MFSLNPQRSELQSGNITGFRPREPSDLDILSQKSGDLKDIDDKDLCSVSLVRSLPASPAQNLKRRRTITTNDNQKIDAGMIALPSNLRHHGRRLHSLRNSFGGWLDQQEGCKALSKSSVYDAAQPPKLKSDLANIVSRFEPTMEPAKPSSALKSSRTVRGDRTRFNCGWLECHDGFGDRPSLREHVLDHHLAQDSIVGSPAYICLWRRCNSASSLPFSNTKFIIEHLDRKHGLGAFARADCEQSELSLESESISYNSLSIALADDNEAGDAVHQAVRGTKKRSTEVPNDPASSSHLVSDGHDPDRIIARPRIQVSRILDSAGLDTQISLCDSAFESQASLHARTKTRPEQMQDRKNAYRAAKGRSDLSWENDHDLISASGGHSIEETEL